MNTTNVGTIDIARVIETKTGRKLPEWIANLLRRLIHEREINDILTRHADKLGGDFLAALHAEFDMQVSWHNPEYLPESGRAIFATNHPLGGLDGIGIAYLLYKQYGDVRYMVNDLLYHLRPLQPVFLPVNTYGAQQRDSVARIQEVMQSEIPVGTFPAGYCSRHLDGRIQDRPWQRSFINLAIAHERDIVPLHFVGQNSRHFYLIDRMRKALGIKFDLCTALLPDEMFRARGQHFKVLVGQPISWQSLAESPLSPQAKADLVRERCYALRHEYDAHL